MSVDKNKYKQMTKKASPPSPKGMDYISAFVIGGFICVIGQLLMAGYTALGMTKEQIEMAVPVTLVLIAAILTGLKVFDDIAKHAGAGTLVPITGFANAVAAPAIEFKTEGHVLGIGVKMFTVAGPVIVFGTTAAAIYGLIIWIANMIW